LEIAAELKGLPSDRVENVVRNALLAVGLSSDVRHSDDSNQRATPNLNFTNTCAKFLSGGNKRKLSFALAFVGSPEVVLLDEATSGVDPMSKRLVWNTISHMVSSTLCSVIMTSHNIEEICNLSSRVGMMANGEFQCLGTLGQLKQKHGSSYRIVCTVRGRKDVNGDGDAIAKLKESMNKMFTHCECTDEKWGGTDSCQLIFSLPFRDDKDGNRRGQGPEFGFLAHAFEKMNRLREDYGTYFIDEFTISQFLLEDIFIRLAKAQENAAVEVDS
jgi:ATP-binding cassette subfamily A (ABC1) protein 5